MQKNKINKKRMIEKKRSKCFVRLLQLANLSFINKNETLFIVSLNMNDLSCAVTHVAYGTRRGRDDRLDTEAAKLFIGSEIQVIHGKYRRIIC